MEQASFESTEAETHLSGQDEEKKKRVRESALNTEQWAKQAKQIF